MRPRPSARAIATAGLALSLQAGAALAQQSVRAVRGSPRVDGALTDVAWAGAPWTPAFVQRLPDTGARARHRTRARVLYDDDALYVAVECATDARPDARLARRDAIPSGEWVRVLVDARGEGATAFAFQLNPAGVQADAVVQGDGDADAAWDAVWDGETRVTERGWTAELRIPWRVLRFDPTRAAFRVQIERNDFAAAESLALVPIAPDAPRFVAGFALLAGVTNVRPPRVFELSPYLLGRARLVRDPSRLDPTPTLSGTAGADAKLGLTPDLVLDASINPDFGQVEVDPTVLNLSTIEPFFPERRPFFVEGTDLFRTPLRILHTRRIGASFGAPTPAHPGGTIESVDPTTTIWGAAKLSGRVGPFSMMVLDGITAPVFAHERYAPSPGQSATYDQQLAPVTNWLAARLRAPTGVGSSIGAILTEVARVGQPHDVVGGVDWDLRAPDGVHRFRGQLAASQAWNTTDQSHAGQAMYLEASRAEDPAWIWALRARVYSHSFDPNGLGYLERPDLMSLVFDTTLRTPHPLGPYRRISVNPWVWRDTNTAGLVINQGAGLECALTFRNLWQVGAGGTGNTERYDDRETRGGMPYLLTPSASGWAWITSDERAPVRGTLFYSMLTQNGGHQANASLSLAWTPATFVTLSASGNARAVVDVPRWVANQTGVGGTLSSVFGRQNAQIFDTSVRAAVAFSRRITLDVFSQLLVGSLRYDQYSTLVRPDLLMPTAYGPDASYDEVALTVNAIARYEYLRGSFFTLVFLHRAYVSAARGAENFGHGLGLLADGQPDDLLMAKMTYLVL